MSRKLRVTLDVTYEQDIDADDARRVEYAMRHMIGQGVLTGESDLEVDVWSLDVEVEETED